MPELRWALALLGVLFLCGLAWWELRRPREATHTQLDPHGTREPRVHALPAHREPSLTLPEIRAREPLYELPAVEVVGDALEGLRAGAADDAQRSEGCESAAPPERADPFEITVEQGEEDEPIVPVPQAPPMPQSLLVERGASAPTRVDPIVEWPGEDSRRILALRVVALGERFSGHAVRQALAAEGFVLGKFAIFHRCASDGRAVVSAANLTKPGTFDRDAIDTQRCGGLNLFAVLPGPLPAVRAFDELVASARNVCERLQGALQDDSGEPLTPLRIAAIRESLAHDA
ncbi:MAG TPA: cell division protein ZipA C-terminal FtsZ-binding domain-containing protein [Steroidobacteraceae bacterium]|nr:cell division protein ZipA C-terminal FtsZ-binding domain-containing protein [Steroidobacteraceae bacterium]